MPVKRLDIPEIGTVNLYKRKGVRSMRLSIGSTGSIRLTLPKWVPYSVGIEFIASKKEWIQNNQHPPKHILQTDDHIGKAHRLVFVPSPTARSIKTRVTGNEIRVVYPSSISYEDKEVQIAAENASFRALKSQAEQLIPVRVKTLAAKHGFSYRSVSVKRLKSRWGSCDHLQQLTFNLFLMQLPWPLIDYVILHELQHTTVLKHGPAFWAALDKHTSDLKILRKDIAGHKPVLLPRR